MSNLNVVVLEGNLTRDPELRFTPSGAAVANFSIGVNESFKQGDEWKTYASFIDITVWGKQAENCSEYLAKGSHVAVKGRLKQERWETEGGDTRSRVVVIADMVVSRGERWWG